MHTLKKENKFYIAPTKHWKNSKNLNVMCITHLIIDLNIEICCDSMCVVCSVCLGRITKHKTIFNLILSVGIYSCSQDKSLSKKLTGHFGSCAYKTLNPILAERWTPQGSQLHPWGLFSAVLPATFSRVPDGLRVRKLLNSKCWGRKWWPLIKNDAFLSTHLTFWGGLEKKPGLEIPFPPKLGQYSWEMQTSQQVFLGVPRLVHDGVSLTTIETRNPHCTRSGYLAL